ncbi:MAG: alpha/beta hydrolase family protein [Blastopirellula sp. JB062]
MPLRRTRRIMAIALVGWQVVAAVHGEEVAGEPIDAQFVSRYDESTQKYVMIFPDDAKRKSYDLLIALHGHGSDRWQFVNSDRGEVKAARDAARRYQMIYVSPDYRAKTSWMGPAAEADMVQLIELLKRKRPIGKVIVCGASMGGSSALTFAALHPGLVDGVVSMNGTANHLEFANFQEAISASFGGSKREKLTQYKRRSAEYWPEKLTMPIALTTGGMDRSVPPESVLRLAEVLRQLERPVFLIHREEIGHFTTYDDACDAFEYVLKQVVR